jgi:hypothetical protein
MLKSETTHSLGDAELNELLTGGRLSGRQYDEVYENIVQRMGREPRRIRPALLLAAAASIFGGIGLVALVESDPLSASRGLAEPPGFTSKGGRSHVAPVVEAAVTVAVVDAGCPGRPRRVCSLGDTLLFSASATATPGYLFAYARPVGQPEAEPIWYFGGPDALDTPLVEAFDDTRVVPRGVRLGPPHMPGRYEIFAWVSPSALPASAAPDTPSRGVFDIQAPDSASP